MVYLKVDMMAVPTDAYLVDQTDPRMVVWTADAAVAWKVGRMVG